MAQSTGLAILFAALIATAFFVMVEFAVVKANAIRIKKLASEGNKKAMEAQRVMTNLDTYLSACQLGITVASLLIGWFGEPALHHLVEPLVLAVNLPETATSVVTFGLVFGVVTFVHVVLGELVPKSIAINYSEKMAMSLSKPLILFYRITKPIIWAMNTMSGLICKLFGLKTGGGHAEIFSEEELILLMTDSYEHGKINSTEYNYVNNIFDFDKIQAREIMVPRNDMVTVDINQSNEEILAVITKERYTRLPVVNGDKDNILGIIHTKEFYEQYIQNNAFDLQAIINPLVYVSEATPIKKILHRMQNEGIHLMILADEYGGTEGMITLEDVLEEIVGEIKDEFDEGERPDIQTVNENEIIVDGKVSIHDINELFESEINEKDLDTIGGWLFMEDPKLKPAQVLTKGKLQFEVIERTETRFNRIKIKKVA